MLTRQFQAFSSDMAALIAPLQCHILYILPEFLVQISNLAKTHHQGLIDIQSFMSQSIQQSHRNHIATTSIRFVVIKIQTRKSNVFFEKKMWPENVQEFSKLTLFLISTFFCFKKYHFMLPTFLGRALLLPNDALKPKPSTLKPQTFDQTLLSVFVC